MPNSGGHVTLSANLRRRLAAGLLAAVALTALTACGAKETGTADTPDGTTGNAPGGGGGGAMAAYFQCLQENGVTMTRPGGGARPSGAPDGNGAPPSGGPGGDGGPPNGGGAPVSGAPGGARPSGGPGGGGRQITKPDGVSDETWTKATEACAGLAPTPAATS
jgi:hypothetical protein